MPENKAKLRGMKNSNVNMRVSDELRPVVDYLKLLPGGITKWFEDQLKKVKVDQELFEKLKKMM